jgi:nitroimidazol reductase NimA-like FMN-containing flavoprotein (pyridoxamine 5'-phosphate oxidase superfamily)
MAEVTRDDNREGTGKQPGRADCHILPGAPGPRARRPRARPADSQPAECLGLLEAGGIGRVGFASADGIKMLPVNFAVTGKAIIFRTALDTLLAVYADGQVSFEADHLDQAHREGWSVLVQGHARTVTDEREVKRLEDRTHLEPWAGGARDVYVRITPTRISGRCIEPGWASPLAPDTKA